MNMRLPPQAGKLSTGIHEKLFSKKLESHCFTLQSPVSAMAIPGGEGKTPAAVKTAGV